MSHVFKPLPLTGMGLPRKRGFLCIAVSAKAFTRAKYSRSAHENRRRSAYLSSFSARAYTSPDVDGAIGMKPLGYNNELFGFENFARTVEAVVGIESRMVKEYTLAVYIRGCSQYIQPHCIYFIVPFFAVVAR